MDTSPIVIESQVDWLTASAFGKDPTNYFNILASTIAVQERQHEDEELSFRLNGYQGYRIGRLRYGERENAGLIQLSGDLAHTWFDDVYSHADHITRLDIAVTVDTGQADPLLGKRAYEDACQRRFDHPKMARPWTVNDADGGWTTYVGDRTSDWFLRIYDKHAESIAARDPIATGQYERCWRYELEAKGVAATALGKQVYGSLTRADYVRNFVADWCRKHGIEPAFPLTGDVAKLSELRRRSDRATRLAWLQHSVSPAIKWLLTTGDRTEVLEALGLTDPNNGSMDASSS